MSESEPWMLLLLWLPFIGLMIYLFYITRDKK